MRARHMLLGIMMIVLIVYLPYLFLFQSKAFSFLTLTPSTAPPTPPPRVTVIGMANEGLNNHYCYTIGSALLNGYDLFLYTAKRMGKVDYFVDNRYLKVSAYVDYCNQNSQKDNDVVMFSDMRDVCFVRKSEEMYKLFKEKKQEFKKRVFFGVESKQIELFPSSSSLFSF